MRGAASGASYVCHCTGCLQEKKKLKLNLRAQQQINSGGESKQSQWLTWIEGKVIYEALPGNEGNLLDGRRGAAETKFLQMQQRVDEGASSVQQLCGKHIYKMMSIANTDI